MPKAIAVDFGGTSIKIGVTQGAVSQWETGEAKPTLENLIAIAKFFGCKVDDLIDK